MVLKILNLNKDLKKLMRYQDIVATTVLIRYCNELKMILRILDSIEVNVFN